MTVVSTVGCLFVCFINCSWSQFVSLDATLNYYWEALTPQLLKLGCLLRPTSLPAFGAHSEGRQPRREAPWRAASRELRGSTVRERGEVSGWADHSKSESSCFRARHTLTCCQWKREDTTANSASPGKSAVIFSPPCCGNLTHSFIYVSCPRCIINLMHCGSLF